MNTTHQEGRKHLWIFGAGLAAVLMALLPASSIAQTIAMDDGGSTAIINTGGGPGNLGMNAWTVLGGNNQLNQQWFWYSVGGGLAQPINTIGGLTITTNSVGPNVNDVTITYANLQLAVTVEYVLTGDGPSSGGANLTEYLAIDNNTANAFNLSFYQYSNFNLLQNNNNSVSISGDSGSGYSGAQQTTGGPGGSGIAEVIDEPNATYAEANYANAGTLSTMYNLNNTANYNLNDNTSAGPGNVTWAFQWNANLTAAGTGDDELDITKDKGLSVNIVPEPSTVWYIAMGAVALGLGMRRKSS
jgi:PEP-CTERM motif-containing protein